MRWNYQPICDESISLLSQNLQTSRILAKLLLRSGISDPEEARRFLEPRLRQLDDPFKLTNLRSAVERIQKALENDEKIMVLGDYDVDGVTSTGLLVCLLERLGASPGYIVPRRLEECYGLTRWAIDRVLAKGPIDLFITVDCGTNSFEEVAYLREKGIDVIIVDHHRSLNGIPEDCILINPHVVDEPDQPWTHLSAV